MTGPDPFDYGWWLVGRAAGVVALVLVTLSVAIGLAMAAGLARRPGLKPVLIAVHEHAALAGLVSIAVHGIALLGDPWLRPGLSGVLVPFTLDYRPVFTGLGIVAGYLAALVGLSFYARRRIGARRWRSLHRASALVWVLAVVHTLGAGTDVRSAWLAWLLGTTIPLLLALLAGRMLRPRSRAAPRRAPAPAR